MAQIARDDTLALHFPLTFKNGYTVETLAFWCSTCGIVARDSQVTGTVSMLIPGVADIWAVYVCSCGHEGDYRIRLKEDKTCKYVENRRWRTAGKSQLPLSKRVFWWVVGTANLCMFWWHCKKIKLNLLTIQAYFESLRNQKNQ